MKRGLLHFPRNIWRYLDIETQVQISSAVLYKTMEWVGTMGSIVDRLVSDEILDTDIMHTQSSDRM